MAGAFRADARRRSIGWRAAREEGPARVHASGPAHRELRAARRRRHEARPQGRGRGALASRPPHRQEGGRRHRRGGRRVSHGARGLQPRHDLRPSGNPLRGQVLPRGRVRDGVGVERAGGSAPVRVARAAPRRAVAATAPRRDRAEARFGRRTLRAVHRRRARAARATSAAARTRSERGAASARSRRREKASTRIRVVRSFGRVSCGHCIKTAPRRKRYSRRPSRSSRSIR